MLAVGLMALRAGDCLLRVICDPSAPSALKLSFVHTNGAVAAAELLYDVRMTDIVVHRPSAPDHREALFAGLNEAQCRAVEAVDGPVLVLAGAGTGKTRVLTTRLAHILGAGAPIPARSSRSPSPTRPRARCASARAMIGGAAEGLWLGTFHSLAARILRRHAELVGLNSNFTILDTDDQLRLLKQLDRRRASTTSLAGARAAGVIERWKDRGLTPDKVPAGEAGDCAAGRAVALYARLPGSGCATLNAADFGDLLLHSLTLLAANPDVLAD